MAKICGRLWSHILDSKQGLLYKFRPDLAEADIATTNGEHCTVSGWVGEQKHAL